MEDVFGGNKQFFWGNVVFVFVICLIVSFVDYCWCVNVIGLQGGGIVGDLLVYIYELMGELQNKILMEVLILECCEFELVEQGFMVLIMCKNSDNVVFFLVNLVQKLKFFGNIKEGKEVELNYKFSIQLFYMFVVSCLVYYIKVI